MKNGKFLEFNRNVWYQDDLIHREDGPAVEHITGLFHEWYLNGKRHREGGPAIVVYGKLAEWYFNGELHREDGR